VRLWFEIRNAERRSGISWRSFSKGGIFSPFYAEIHLVVGWDDQRGTFESFFGRPGRLSEKVEASGYFFRPGVTWPRRTTKGISPRVLPAGCIFADKGPSAFVPGNEEASIFTLLAVMTSRPFEYLVGLQLAAADSAARSYEVGIIQRTPIPNLTDTNRSSLAELARRAWSLKRTLDTTNETSHAFTLPAALCMRGVLGGFEPTAIEEEIENIQRQIDDDVSELYGLGEDDRITIARWNQVTDLQSPIVDIDEAMLSGANDSESEDEDEEASYDPTEDHTESLLSWLVGVVACRFDVRLATGERNRPSEPEPFDPLSSTSPGMLPGGDAPFHPNIGVLVDDVGHPHDIPYLIGTALDRVGIECATDIRTWLRREFFQFHLKQYSKSRRKAPIYWPLSTASGSYTLWLYYPALTDQSLFIATNDFVGTKLERQVEPALRTLRQKTGRSPEEERELETLQTLHEEPPCVREVAA
jgi:hypothetical protein